LVCAVAEESHALEWLRGVFFLEMKGVFFFAVSFLKIDFIAFLLTLFVVFVRFGDFPSEGGDGGVTLGVIYQRF
jgi:hypothetical protein